SFERTRVASHNTQQRLIAAAAGWIHLILTNRGAELAKSAAKAPSVKAKGRAYPPGLLPRPSRLRSTLTQPLSMLAMPVL
ncbi:hypothetical protein, partial [Edaphobacter sp. HDX4]|uniref:hypothetical protein n=1 Tax=Edaphobacter sp. HDX4 TaxID=2794064 RepID=UPI002FE6777B